jgi:acyl carrier protein
MRVLDEGHPWSLEQAMQGSKDAIRAFLARFFRTYEIQDHEDIFSLGFVNSLFALELVMFVEKEFSFTVENEDLNIDNFRSINAIAALIERKASGAAPIGTMTAPVGPTAHERDSATP